MSIFNIMLFGITQDIIGSEHIKISMEDLGKDSQITTTDLLNNLKFNHPKLNEVGNLLLAVNQEYASAHQKVQPGDEIALIPPVSGG